MLIWAVVLFFLSTVIRLPLFFFCWNQEQRYQFTKPNRSTTISDKTKFHKKKKFHSTYFCRNKNRKRHILSIFCKLKKFALSSLLKFLNSLYQNPQSLHCSYHIDLSKQKEANKYPENKADLLTVLSIIQATA